MSIKRTAESDILERPTKRIHFEKDPFIQDVICEIARCLLAQNDFQTLWACNNVNTHWRRSIVHFQSTLTMETLNFAKCCQLEDRELPVRHVLHVMEKMHAYAPFIAPNKEGVYLGSTLLTMPKDLTLAHLEQIGLQHNIYLEYDNENIFNILNAFKIEKTYTVLLTNNIFLDTSHKSFEQAQNYVKEMKSELPYPLELIALCTFTFIKHQKFLFGWNSNMTIGYTNFTCRIDNEEMYITIGLFCNSLITKGKHRGQYGKILHIMARNFETSSNLGAPGRLLIH